MKFVTTEFLGLYLIEYEKLEDERGFFARTFCQEKFHEQGINTQIIQCSISYNRQKGTLRGMHYQIPPFEEAKLVRCVKGAIYDLVIDLRPASMTYKKWVAFELSAHNSLYIPKGFAHGFLTLEKDTEVFYQISEKFSPEHARGIRWNDPTFSLSWPLPISVISQKDQNYPNYE